jgi:hypothetical protein
MVCDDHFGPDPESLTTYIGYGLNFGLIFDQDTAHRETWRAKAQVTISLAVDYCVIVHISKFTRL